MIGPMPPRLATKTNPIGGTSVHFRESVKELRKRNVAVQIIDTTGPRVNLHPLFAVLRAWSRLIRITVHVLVAARRSDLVFLSSSAGKSLMMASMIWLLCALQSRPMALRIFGGDFAQTYEQYSTFMRRLADLTFLRSHRVYVQTRDIERRFRSWTNVRWFPNTRDVVVHSRNPVSARKFLFVSQLRNEKGLREALEACRGLPHDCHLSVFGPPMPETDLSLFEHHAHATYGGVLQPDVVPSVIDQHDVLLLPSYFAAEGYPGIIIEALQCGRPVITTWWKSIPEVVDDGLNGLLVTPRSTSELRHALFRIIDDQSLFRSLCRGAKIRGDFFRSGPWYDWMAEDIRALVGVRRAR